MKNAETDLAPQTNSLRGGPSGSKAAGELLTPDKLLHSSF